MKIGFLINPVAGMGGKVALKGTDGEGTLRRALELGAVPMAHIRAETAVAEFAEVGTDHEFVTASGQMGEDLLLKYGLNVRVVYQTRDITTAADTSSAAEAILSASADILLFAGGDGTARDVCAAVGDKIPVVGVPAGVKIHSGVYAKKPRDAGLLIKNVLLGKVKRYVLTEVVDIDEDAFRNNIVQAMLFGYMKIPDDREFMQERKSGGSVAGLDDAADIAAYTVSKMERDAIYLIGSGTTTLAVTERLGLAGTLLGVDAVVNGAIAGRDLTENEIKNILKSYDLHRRYLIITVIGGQGHIFGRGNQQLSPDVIRMIPKDNIQVIASSSKISQLFGRSLIADTGDASLDLSLSGYMPVITGYARYIMVKVC